MRIGITFAGSAAVTAAFVRDNRTAAHVLELFQAMSFVEQAAFVGSPDQARHAANAMVGPVLTFDQALAGCDLVVQVGGLPDPAWIGRFRALGRKYVLMVDRDPYATLVEGTIFDRVMTVEPGACYDAVWVTDGHRGFAPMLQTLHRCPVHVVPFVWSPAYVDLISAGQAFAYTPQPLAGRPRVCVVHAGNDYVAQMGIMALIVIEQCYLADPGRIARIEFANGAHFVDQITFHSLVQAMTAHRAGIVTIRDAVDFHGFLGAHGDVLVSYTHAAPCDHAQIDAIYAGYPVLHNQRDLCDLGYFYPEMDVAAAHAAFARLADHHDDQFATHLAATRDALHRFSPRNRANVSDLSRTVFAMFP